MYGKDEAHIHNLHSVRASVLRYCIESGDGLSGIPTTRAIRDKLDESYGDVPKVKKRVVRISRSLSAGWMFARTLR